jgi:hypothetical protein
MRPGFVGSYGLGPGRPAMRADTRENPVGENGVMTPSQTWSNLGKCVSDLLFGSIRGDEPSSEQADLVRAASFCVPTPEKIPGVKMGL